MDNPYAAPTDMATEGSWLDVLARIAAVILHLVLWVVFIVLAGPVLAQYIGDPSPSAFTPDAQLTMTQSFNRFVVVYGFLPVMHGLVLDIGVWIALRRFGRRVRWRWLAITSALIPVTTVATWLIFRPVLFA